MFGTYRALLAVIVASVHFANFPFIGHYAVFGFFVLSGYIITYIMQNTYGYTVNGIFAFALNRFLRVYPLYWVSCIFAVFILLVLGWSATTGINRHFALPDNTFLWFRNIALLVSFNGSQTLNAPGWALTIELVFYTAIGLGLSRGKRITQAWFLFSVLYTVYLLFNGADFVKRYSTLGAASLPMSGGAMLYFYRDELHRNFQFLTEGKYAPIIVATLLFMNWGTTLKLGVPDTWGLYLNCLVCALMVVVLMNRRELPFVSKWWDDWLGYLSYPIFCIHYPLAFLLLYLYKKAGIQFDGPGLRVLFLFLPITLFAAWLMAFFIERRVEVLRTKVKTKLRH